MGLFSGLKKQLKRTTKILDPVGHQIRKSTGGSYMDPLNQYNSHPNTAPQYQPAQSQGLKAAPGGQQTLGTINIGGAPTGGRTYTPNYFINPGSQNSVPGLTAPQGGKGGAQPPAGPIKPNMGFGSSVQGGNMQPLPAGTPNPLQGTGIANSMQNVIGKVMQGYQPAPQSQKGPQMQDQMARIKAMRGRMV